MAHLIGLGGRAVQEFNRFTHPGFCSNRLKREYQRVGVVENGFLLDGVVEGVGVRYDIDARHEQMGE
jgi:hypothetical protein